MSEIIEYEGKTFEVEDGFLVNFDDWCKEWVEYARKEEGIEVFTDEHWKVLFLIRKYYKESGVDPGLKEISDILGFSREELCKLFPRPRRGAFQIAGLPNIF